jgi:hypothetical protein
MRPQPAGWWPLPVAEAATVGCLALDVRAELGAEVVGPEAVFSTVLAEVALTGKNLRRVKQLAAEVLRDPPRVVPRNRDGGTQGAPSSCIH